MTRYADLATLQRNISPDVVIIADSRPTIAPAEIEAATVALEANAGALGVEVYAPMLAATEHDEQAALFEWADLAQGEHPELCMLFAIPNGGARHPAVAAQLKAEGVKAGVPDIFLACAREHGGKTYHGLFVELKRADRSNHATSAQRAWIEMLRRYGYSAVVAYGCAEAQQAIMSYLVQEG